MLYVLACSPLTLHNISLIGLGSFFKSYLFYFHEFLKTLYVVFQVSLFLPAGLGCVQAFQWPKNKIRFTLQNAVSDKLSLTVKTDDVSNGRGDMDRKGLLPAIQGQMG